MPSSSPGAPVPFLRHLGEDSARVRDVLAAGPGDAPVPTCPQWQDDDLLWLQNPTTSDRVRLRWARQYYAMTEGTTESPAVLTDTKES